MAHKSGEESLGICIFLLSLSLSFQLFNPSLDRNPSTHTTPQLLDSLIPSKFLLPQHLNPTKMRFYIPTASLAICLLSSSSLTSVLALPQAWCEILNIFCFEPPPPPDCEYCGSWAGHDAVVSSISFFSVALGIVTNFEQLDCDSHGLITYCGGRCTSAPGQNIDC
jgi:hypothetical protein